MRARRTWQAAKCGVCCVALVVLSTPRGAALSASQRNIAWSIIKGNRRLSTSEKLTLLGIAQLTGKDEETEYDEANLASLIGIGERDIMRSVASLAHSKHLTIRTELTNAMIFSRRYVTLVATH